MAVRTIVRGGLAAVARRTRGGLAIGLVAMVAAVATVVSGSAAHAEPVPLVDGFENNPNSRWGFSGSGTGIAFGFLTDRGRQRSGRVNAVLHVTTGFIAVGRTVQIDPPGSISDCVGRIFVDPAIAPATVNLEVIDPATFQYITPVNTVTFDSDTGYTQLAFNGFRWRAAPVLFRVALLGNGAESVVYIDDLTVNCVRSPA